jgi:uncharacterized protein DUF4386
MERARELGEDDAAGARMSELAASPRGTVSSQQSYARLAGLMFLLVLAFDIAGVIVGFFVAGDGDFADQARRIIAAETVYRFSLMLGLAGALATVPLAVGLYVTLKPVDPNLAAVGLVFRALEAAIGAVAIVGSFSALELYRAGAGAGESPFDAGQLGVLRQLAESGAGTSVAAIFFCVGSTVFFYLLSRSAYIPRVLSLWGLFSSLVYMAYWAFGLVAPDFPGAVTIAASLPILVAEVSTGAWLLIKGIKTPPTAD